MATLLNVVKQIQDQPSVALSATYNVTFEAQDGKTYHSITIDISAETGYKYIYYEGILVYSYRGTGTNNWKSPALKIIKFIGGNDIENLGLYNWMNNTSNAITLGESSKYVINWLSTSVLSSNKRFYKYGNGSWDTYLTPDNTHRLPDDVTVPTGSKYYQPALKLLRVFNQSSSFYIRVDGIPIRKKIDLHDIQMSLGSHQIKVIAKGRNYRDSVFSNTLTITYKNKLPTPSISISGSILTITSVANATSYDIYANGLFECNTTSLTYNLDIFDITGENFNITVIARATDYYPSDESNVVIYVSGLLTPTIVSVSGDAIAETEIDARSEQVEVYADNTLIGTINVGE